MEEALAIYERLGDTMGEAECLTGLVRLLHDDKQLDAADFEMALEIATSIDCHTHVFGINYSLAQLSILEGRFDKANV